MKTVSEKRGIEVLSVYREDFRNEIQTRFEPRAKSCETCEVKGSCCTDEHFVNVHITRLEGVAIRQAVRDLPRNIRERVRVRNQEVLERLGAKGSRETYSCPLFEPGAGCLVHHTAKPLACINHACYESKEDLPPDELLEVAENKIGRLNERVYRSSWEWRPIPEWLCSTIE